METQYISLNMTPTGVNPCFHISQYDVGRILGFIVHAGGVTVDLDTYTCTVEATRSDGTAITSAVATTDNIGTFEVTPTMSNKADKYRCQLVIVDENSKRIASLPFDMEVTKAAMDENSEAIEEDASLYQQYTEAVQGAIAKANADIQAEENARIAAVSAEASTRASADSNLQSQINQIVAPSGEAPSAAEVQNARIGADGVTYDTLGNAIRGQLKSAITYKADKAYGGATSGSYLQLTAGSTWNSSTGNTQSAGTSNRARNDATKKTIDMKSVSVKSGYEMIVYGNNLGVGHPLTQIGNNWITSIDIKDQSYNYLFVVVRRSDNGTITSDNLSDVLTITKYSELPYAVKQDIENEVCYNTEFSIAASGSHSSTLDKISMDFVSGEDYWFYIESSIPVQAYIFSGSTSTAITTSRNTFFKYTATGNFDSVGLFASNTTENSVTITAYVANKASIISKMLNDCKAGLLSVNNRIDALNIDNRLCYQNTFSVAAGADHSSKNDKITLSFEPGIEYLFYVKSSIAAQTYVFSGDTGASIATIRNSFFKYTPQSAFDSVGVFVRNNTASAIDVTFYVATDISILQRIVNDYGAKTDAINNTLNDVFLTDGFNVAISNRDTKIAAFSDLFIDAETTESFLFFTDPHTVNANVTDEAMRKGINAIELVFNATPTTYCICGGDWLQDGDTKAVALYRLGYIDGFMRKKFGDYYLPMLGNHDTNYQGIDTTESDANTGELSQGALQQIWFRKYGKMYYSHKGINSRFYIFDTGTDWDNTMTDYRWEQVDWFANQLLTNDDAHSIMFLHILTNAAKATFEADVPGNVTNFASNLFEVAQKYNARGTLTLNGHTYDFSAKTGKIAFAQCGHSHYDSVVTYKDIPAILTINATATPKFDLCYVNYVTGKYKMIRVGDGNDRTVNIVT